LAAFGEEATVVILDGTALGSAEKCVWKFESMGESEDYFHDLDFYFF